MPLGDRAVIRQEDYAVRVCGPGDTRARSREQHGGVLIDECIGGSMEEHVVHLRGRECSGYIVPQNMEKAKFRKWTAAMLRPVLSLKHRARKGDSVSLLIHQKFGSIVS